MTDNTILLIGGDDRQKELYKLLKQDFNNVYTYGLFDEEAVVKDADILILPFPAIKGEFINAPFCKNKILPGDITPFIKNTTKIIGGMIPKNMFDNEFFVFDYATEEELVIYNAALTAEIAIAFAIKNSDIALLRSKVLITGFGRIGKFLANYLKAFSCDITVAARKKSDFGFIGSLGFNTLNYEYLKEDLNKFDFVFNTVPYKIFDNDTLKKANKNTLFIELASAPGGFEISKDNQINLITALGLPGKYSKKSAAEIIYKTIRPYLKKEEKT